MRILEFIQMLEDEIQQSPKPRIGSGNRRIVDCDRMLDLLGDMKVMIPEEIRSAQTVLNEKKGILEDANIQAASIMATARVQAERLVAREPVITEAKKRAQNIIDQAEDNALNITQSTRNYAHEVLGETQRFLRDYIDAIDKSRVELYQRFDPPDKLVEEAVASARDDLAHSETKRRKSDQMDTSSEEKSNKRSNMEEKIKADSSDDEQSDSTTGYVDSSSNTDLPT